MGKNSTNSADMRAANRKLILNIIRKNPVSRAELSRKTGLTRAAVTMIADDLLKEGILEEAGVVHTNTGRKPVLLDLNTDNNPVAGLYISREECYMAILDIKASVIEKREIPLEDLDDAHHCLERICSQFHRLIGDLGIPLEKYMGMGVVTPGPVDHYSGTVLNPPNFNMWHNINICGEIGKEFPFPVYLDNYSHGLALAEKNYGAGVNYNSFVLILVDEGIGAGIILDNKLLRGVGGFGGELGHTTINFRGRKCSCGNRGCLEVYASIPALIREVEKRGKNLRSWKEIADMAAGGDGVCKKAVEDEGGYLSAGIVNITNILEPEAIILTGDINYRGELLILPIQKKVGDGAITRSLRRLSIINAAVKEDIEAVAAASVMIEKFFE